MTPEMLIGRVAVAHLKQQLVAEPEGALRFCMIGLDAVLVTEIARAALADAELAATLDIRVPRELAIAGELSDDIITDEAAAHWRNSPLSAPQKRGVLFAVSNEELQRIGKTAETLPKLETERLRELYATWIAGAGLGGDRLQPKERERLEAALRAVNQTHVARTIESFADYVLRTAERVEAGSFVEQALDEALPALHLPRNAGRFRDIAAARKADTSEWYKKYRQLHTLLRPLLVLENDKGESIEQQVRANLEQLRKDYEPHEIAAVESLLGTSLSPDRWSEPQERVAALDWQRIKDFFEGVERTRQVPLGQATAEFFEDNFPDDIGDDDREYLCSGLSPPPKEPSAEALEFFDTHRERLANNKKLYGRWERYIYRNPETYDDFLEGFVATLHRLREAAGEMSANPRLVVRIPNGKQKELWRTKNAAVIRCFAQRHHGLAGIFGREVEFDFGRLFYYFFPEPADDLKRGASSSKDARSLKFEIELDPDGAAEKMIFYWQMPAEALAVALPEDLRALANASGERALLMTADVARQAVSAKGQIQRIALSDLNTLRDVDDGNHGMLVAPNLPEGDLYDQFTTKLEELRHGGFIDDEQGSAVREALDRFIECYTQAIRDWTDPEGPGLASEALLTQAEAYGDLLHALQANANKDICRETLWMYALRIGVANVGGSTEAAIVTPWQPLRLAELHAKTRQAAALIKDVLTSGYEDVQRADLFFTQCCQELRSSYYPEVCVGLQDGEPSLLATTSSLGGYTLAEPPRRGKGADGADDALDVDPEVAARCFANVGEQYLDLLPHEKANFSVVLYNAESKGLPKALASELSGKVEQESDLRCDLLLTHGDPGRMRRIYEQQNVAVAESGGSMLASEAARNFLSRLRVGFLEAAAVPEHQTIRAADLVFLQDVVGRSANVVWKPAPGHAQPHLSTHVPARWSRRRPIVRGDTSAAVYLAAPVQPRPCQLYLNALHRVLEGGTTGLDDVIPAREVSFRDGNVGEVIRETHRLGEWVVNFDELVDRRLLEQRDISVIRHIHDRNIDRNLVVSTTAEPRLLRALIDYRLERVDPGLSADERRRLARDLIGRAAKLSGLVVMRAARYGRYANELIGVVLSMERLRRALGDDKRHTGWYFLDDYASWFGQREERIADILAIAARVEDGGPVLKLAISECKFVRSQGYQVHKKKSARQLAETVERVTRALDPAKTRIDRDVWLHRIGDLMLEGMEPFDDALLNGWTLQRWSEEVRADRVPIKIVGFSHIFVHDDEASVESSDPSPIRGLPNCRQIVLDSAGVREEIRRIAGGDGPAGPAPAEAEEGWREALVSLQTGPSDFDKRPRSDESIRRSGAIESAVGPSPSSKTDEAGHGPRLQTPTVDGAARGAADVEPEGSIQAEETEVRRRGTDDEAPRHVLDCKWPSARLHDWIAAGVADFTESEKDRHWLHDTEKALQRALRSYGMIAEPRGSRLTPNAALIRFRGTDDLTVAKVDKRRQELLTSHAIEVINVLAAPGEVVVMVKRPERAILRLQDLWCQRRLPGTAPCSNMSLLLGSRESNGDLLYLNVGEPFAGQPQHGPHTLIAGETGSGKGVLVQNLLLDICATNSPEAAHIWMIDPKAGVDYPWFRRMPHLRGDLVTEQETAVNVFEELVAEMERRNRMLAHAGVSKLTQYNRRIDPAQRMPVIWLFHDELADWMLVDDYRNAVATNVTRLGVKARAAGIHLVLITQRPDKDALPMQLRANLSNRVVLKVADKRNSELVLDEAGAERLLGKGHLAAKLSGEGKVILAQVPFADEDETLELAHIVASAWRNASEQA